MPKWFKWPSAEQVGRWLIIVGGRRFALTVLVQVMTWYLAFLKIIDGYIYRDIVLATSAVFIGSNTYEGVKAAQNRSTVKVAEITGEAPVTINAGEAPIKVELSTKEGETLGR
jgi:hypothetical protein